MNVNAPMLPVSPNVTSPPILTSLAKVRAVLPRLAMIGSLMQSVPVPKAELLPARTLPALIFRPPANVLSPVRVRVPAPSLIRPPLDTVFAKTTSASVVSVRRPAFRSTAPVKLSAAVSVASPRVKFPLIATLLAKVRPVAPMPVSLPPFRRSWPEGPKALSEPTRRTPPRIVVLPA